MGKKECCIDGCSNNALTSVCSKHYWRFQKYGSYDAPPASKEKSVESKFWDRVVVTGDDSCWEWKGAKSADGYGKFHFPDGQLAHRFSFMLHNRHLPSFSADAVVMHSCNNKQCTNPRHLSIGTSSQNNFDARRDGLFKGRTRRVGSIKAEVAALIYMENLPYKALSRKYGCNINAVADIKSGRRYEYAISRYLA